MSFKHFGRARRPKDARRAVIEKKGYGKYWPKQRARALKRDNYTCQKCGYKGKRKKAKNGRKYWTVHVHHKKKIKEFVNLRTKEIDYGKANNLENLVTLCPTCHKVADGHAKMKGFTPLK